MISTNPGQAKSPHQIEREEQNVKQDREQNQIVDLGRIFEMQIDKFIEATGGDVSGKIVLGACDYIIKTYKERMSAMGENYGRLKRVVDQEGIKIREPYVNDGVMPRDNGMTSEILMPTNNTGTLPGILRR